MFFAWVLSTVFGLPYNYTNEKTAATAFISIGIMIGSLALSILTYFAEKHLKSLVKKLTDKTKKGEKTSDV